MNGYELLFIRLDEDNNPTGGVINGQNLRYLNVGYDPETFDPEVDSAPSGYAIVEDLGEELGDYEVPLDPLNDFSWNEDNTKVLKTLRRRPMTSEEKAAAIQELTDNFNNTFGFESWTFNEANFAYEPPVPYPTDGGVYHWRESDTSWVRLPDTVPEDIASGPHEFDVETEQWVAIT